MAHKNYLFTSESVSEGHPDKVCDQISDAILDAFLENDAKLGISDDSLVNTRLGCETLCTTNKIVIAGEGRGQAPLFTCWLLPVTKAFCVMRGNLYVSKAWTTPAGSPRLH